MNSHKNSSKKKGNLQNQPSILSFFGVNNSQSSSQQSQNILTSTKKRTHREMSENNKNYYSENPAKKKKKEIIIIDDDSNEEMNNENKEEEEIINLSKNDNDNIQTPSFTELTKKIKKKKLKKSNNNKEEDSDYIEIKDLESTSSNFNINDYNKSYLEKELKENPHYLDFSINKNHSTKYLSEQEKNLENYISTTMKKEKIIPNDNMTPSSFNKGKSRKSTTNKKSTRNSISSFNEDNLSSISNEEVLNHNEIFQNPQNGLPDFLKPENIKDKFGNKPDDINYDPTTLFVPNDYIKKQTPAMRQFWNFKKDNFDKVLLFKLGKFYELFFDDAIIGNQILELNWMGNDPKKLHVGFPEKILEEKSRILINEGYKVAVVEQTETPEQLKERVKKDNSKDACVNRELCNVFTKGTYLKDDNNNLNDNNNYNCTRNKFCISLVYNDKVDSCDNSQNNDLNYMNNISQNNNNINKRIEWGICIFDVTTLQFYLGNIIEDIQSSQTQSQNSIEGNYTKLMTALYNLCPDELILIRNNIPNRALSFVKSLSSHPQINYIKNSYSLSDLNNLCQKYFGENFQDWNQTILNLFSNEQLNHASLMSLHSTIIYLEKILLANQCLPTAIFHNYDGDITINPNKKMIMDYQAISNLEIIETQLDPKNPETGSLLEYLNKAQTPFGRRLMKNWILNPLCNINDINERFDMVDDFINNEELITKIRNALCKWPDIERKCSKFYKFAMDSNSKAIYFEDIGKNRLNDFFSLINFMISSQSFFEIFNKYIPKFKSKTLINKLKIGTNIPDLNKVLGELKDNYSIVNTKDDKGNLIQKIESKPGVCEEYDNCKNELNQILNTFTEIIQKEKKRMKCAVIQYSHTKGMKYELEIPEEYVKKNRPKEYILTTAKKGYLRFHTPELLENIKLLESTQEKLKYLSQNVNIQLFKQFYSKHNILNHYINIVSEIDCISNLAYISIMDKEKFSRPKFIEISENNNNPYIELIDCVHPCLLSRNQNFVPNNIIIGKEGENLIVITGPNMGGKSTLLRQVCIATIIAQIGCYVPAKKCIMTLVDRIFTRIGASDKLLEGKSTFYVEMEETQNILRNATRNSLVIMDELGRGTSTKDGKVIAKTILSVLENRIKCRVLFTTHYHDIIEWCKNEKNIGLYYMESNVDEKTKDISFLYKFKKGICPESYGISVAKLAGLPESIINMARCIAQKNREKLPFSFD